MKILIVEDEPVTRRLLEVFLSEWGYEVIVRSDGRDAWKLLKEPEGPHLVISDWSMPHMDGIELCRKIREVKRSNYTYFIILSSKAHKKDMVKGLESGADDFIIKPFDKEELRCRVKTGERIVRLEQKIMRLAMTDPLTGLLNRRSFVERVETEVDRAVRRHTPVSIIMMDIDYFKKINDIHGHPVGDQVLAALGNMLSGLLRRYDLVGRFGGEEFIICLPGLDWGEAETVAERIRRHVEKMGIEISKQQTLIGITASFGVATLMPGMDENLESLIRKADNALYAGKAAGRNRVCRAKAEEVDGFGTASGTGERRRIYAMQI